MFITDRIVTLLRSAQAFKSDIILTVDDFRLRKLMNQILLIDDLINPGDLCISFFHTDTGHFLQRIICTHAEGFNTSVDKDSTHSVLQLAAFLQNFLNAAALIFQRFLAVRILLILRSTSQM